MEFESEIAGDNNSFRFSLYALVPMQTNISAAENALNFKGIFQGNTELVTVDKVSMREIG